MYMKRNVYCNALLCGCCIVLNGCNSHQNRQKDAVTVRIASYNIQIGRGMDKKYDLDRTADTIRKFKAETIVLNEVDVETKRSGKVNQAAYLAEKLKLNYVFGRASDRPGGIYGNAVLSVFKLKQLDLIDLPSNGKESRSALVVKVMAPMPYYIVATHLPYEQTPEMEQVRLKCIDLLAGLPAEKKLAPVFLCGDLNSNYNSAVIRKIQDRGFRIANDLSGQALSWPAAEPTVLLDYLCVYPAESVSEIRFMVRDEPLASDHRPVQATFLFGQKL